LGIGLVVAKPVVADFPPLLLMALRFSVAAITLVWFVPIPKPQLPTLFWVALIGATMQYGFTFNGLRYLDASTTALVVQAEIPFLVLLAAVVLKEKLGVRKIVGMVIAFFGIYLISGQPQLQGKSAAIAMVMTGGLLWATGQIMVRRMGAVGGLTTTAWLAVLAAPQLLVASLLFESNHVDVLRAARTATWLTVAYLGFIMTAVGYGCWYYVLGRYPASRVGPFLLLTPVTSVIGGALFLGEQLTTSTLVGGAVIIGGVAILVIEKVNDV